MMKIGSFLLGVVWGILGIMLEQHVVKDYEMKIEPLKKWSCLIRIVIGGLLGLCIALTYGNWLQVVEYIFLAGLLIVLSHFDLKYMLLPTKLIYFGLIGGVLFKGLEALLMQDLALLMNGLLGAIIGYGLFWLIFYGSKRLLKKEGLGFGDVRLMALLGLFLGLEQVFVMIIISSFLAALVGVVILSIKKKSEAFPFGPFLCGGALVMVIWGNAIINWYLSYMGY